MSLIRVDKVNCVNDKEEKHNTVFGRFCDLHEEGRTLIERNLLIVLTTHIKVERNEQLLVPFYLHTWDSKGNKNQTRSFRKDQTCTCEEESHRQQIVKVFFTEGAFDLTIPVRCTGQEDFEELERVTRVHVLNHFPCYAWILSSW